VGIVTAREALIGALALLAAALCLGIGIPLVMVDTSETGGRE